MVAQWKPRRSPRSAVSTTPSWVANGPRTGIGGGVAEAELAQMRAVSLTNYIEVARFVGR